MSGLRRFIMKNFLRYLHFFYPLNWVSIFILGGFVSHLFFIAEVFATGDAKPEVELEGVLLQQQNWSDELVEEVDTPQKGVEVFSFDFVEPGRWNVTDVVGDEYLEGSHKGLDSWIEMSDDGGPQFSVNHSIAQKVGNVRDSLRNALPVEGRPGDQARSIIGRFRDQGSADPEELYNNALQFAKSGEVMDAYLLYYFAARKGHIKSSVALAEMYDPNRFLKGNSSIEEPDAALAFKWYKKAADKGSRIAATRLKFLRHWVETSMPDYTPEKKRLLLLWKQL